MQAHIAYGMVRAAQATGPAVAQARCRSSVVEHSLGKGEVDSSILSGSTICINKFTANDGALVGSLKPRHEIGVEHSFQYCKFRIIQRL